MKPPHSREDPAFTRKTFLAENRKSDFFFHYFSPTVIPKFLFCTPHFFYINSNKTTAGHTKVIHRRLELSFNLYLLLLLWVKTELPKASYI